MVLSTTKRTSSMASISNGNQGGGSKKAGLWPQVGRGAYTSVVMGITTGTSLNHCFPCTMQLNLGPIANISRPVGSTAAGNKYWLITGAH